MEDWRQKLIVVLGRYGVPVPENPTDEQLKDLVVQIDTGKTWECSVCGASVFPWEDCCN